MTRLATVVFTAALTAALLFVAISMSPVEAQDKLYSDRKVAVLQCETEGGGRIGVSAASLTYEAGVSVTIGGQCADAVSKFLAAGLILWSSRPVESDDKVSFNFIFLGGDR